MTHFLYPFQLDPFIQNALEEDIPYQDFSGNAIFDYDACASVNLMSKDVGIICGLKVFQRVFELLDPEVVFHQYVIDGDKVSAGELLMTINGKVNALLAAERVALNILQRMSGVATYTQKLITALDDSRIKIADTRKTTPGMRRLEKYAVTIGGGTNHRYNLSDSIMLKDNHLSFVGDVKKAIKQAREYAPFNKIIEVETESLDMVIEAVEAGADIIMLDNMSIEDTKKAIDIIDGKAQIEVSGNINIDNIARYRGMKIDAISSGAITHSAGILDLSMKNMQVE
ncbi:carboxylating nicotinate-nucleotide diphosphorylase [Aerococcaceae bacterium DSM 111020]|nr:carboxylating nicotinate-nucleotide diphosphorylase [Aerococcaceae bacterium DSM 111020]